MMLVRYGAIADTVLGAFVNVLCPAWLLCIMLIILLSLTTFKPLKKGIAMIQRESKQHNLDAAHPKPEAQRDGNGNAMINAMANAEDYNEKLIRFEDASHEALAFADKVQLLQTLQL